MTTTSKTLRSVSDLVDAGLVAAERRPELDAVAARYAVAVTPAVADLIDPTDPDDPIARQFVPGEAELIEHAEEHADPIGDEAHSPVPGIVHRYPDRALLKVTPVCATYCRFCFRRETVGKPEQALSAHALNDALAYVAARPEIFEVILTGGDPLVLSVRRLGAIVRRLATIDHVQVVRIHTRLPVVAPDRITPALVRALKAEGKATYVVLHANHPRELTPAVRAACARFVDAGIPMLSQSVLLRGINDDAATLGELMRSFVACRIKPYYLHHADLARGTAQFRTTIAAGQHLMRQLHGHYSGLCQPHYVLDIPGGSGKSPIGPTYLQGEPGGYQVTDFIGRIHVYPLA